VKSRYAVLLSSASALGCGAVDEATQTTAAAVDTFGLGTPAQRIVPSAGAGFRELTLGPGEDHTVRQELGAAQPGRAQRRQSLVYFGHLSDFQLADEESPLRIEVADAGPGSGAWRPWEALQPHLDDAMVRQLNAFVPASPIAAGDGTRRAMDLVINTGDAPDNQQLNETLWTRTLMEGGTLDPNSGVDPIGSTHATCLLGNLLRQIPRDPKRYTGVQDFDDYLEGLVPFYDPDQPAGPFAAWPRYPGLMDRAQQPFQAAGLAVPSYIMFGNHDALVQGNGAGTTALELLATGCVKVMAPISADYSTLASALATLDPLALLSLVQTSPGRVVYVPPDPARRLVSKLQYKQIFRAGTQADGHGFGLIDPAEEGASAGAAGYYAWSPRPGLRFISLDTAAEAGIPGVSSAGNIDAPQFEWLRRQLEATDDLVVVLSHHSIEDLTANVPDEVAPLCVAQDGHGHDLNPGCDLDPRSSQPIRLTADLVALLHAHPNVIAWVAGHSHAHRVIPYPHPSGTGGFWSIRVAAEADWPQQSRLIEIFDNRDGTLSLFGTVLDHAAASTAPLAGTPATALTTLDLASIGRTLAYNDPQVGGRACSGAPCGEGVPGDRNVELILPDPR